MSSSSPHKTLAILPLAVTDSIKNRRHADLCRGISCFINEQLGAIPGLRTILQSMILSPEPDKKVWLVANSLWPLDQVLALPIPPELHATHLLQGQAVWGDQQFRLVLEVIDLKGGFPVLHREIEGLVESVIPKFFDLLGEIAELLAETPHARRLASDAPTRSTLALHRYLLGLAAVQGWELEMQGPHDGLQRLQIAVGEDPKFGRACLALEKLVLACLHEGGKPADMAVRTLEIVCRTAPDHHAFAGILGDYYVKHGQFAQARPLLERSLRHDPNGPYQSRVLAGMGTIRRMDGAMDEGRAMLKAAVRRDPQNGDAWDELGRLYSEKGQTAKAEECWRRCLEHLPERSPTLTLLAMLLEDRGDKARAAKLYRMAMGAPEGSPEARERLIQCLVDMRKLEQADEVATEWAECEAENWRAWMILAGVRRRLRQPRAAIHCAVKAMELAPGEEERAKVSLELFAINFPGDFREFQRVLDFNPQTETTEERVTPLAIRKLKNLADRHCTLPALWETLAEKLALAGQLESSISAQRRLVELLPSVARHLNTLGVLLAQAGRREEALRWFELACKRAPGVARHHVNRGIALQELQRYQEAEQSFLEALKTDPDDKEIQGRLETVRRNQVQIPADPPSKPKMVNPPDARGGILRRLLDLMGRRGR